MLGYLTKIKTKIPYSDKDVDINVDGKTLILTGGNGCGKTQLMHYIYSKLKDTVIDRKNYAIADLERDLTTYQKLVMDNGPVHQYYGHFKKQVSFNTEKLMKLKTHRSKLEILKGL